jgi:hypothetical protein
MDGLNGGEAGESIIIKTVDEIVAEIDHLQVE